MWLGGRQYEPRAKTGVCGLGVGGGRFGGRKLAGPWGICPAISRSHECSSLAHTLVGNRRGWARPVCKSALRYSDFFALSSGRRSALHVDGSVDRGTSGISGRGVGADGDGGDRFIFVVTLVVFTDHGTGTDAVECISVGLRRGDIRAAGASGMDYRGPRAVRNSGFAACVRFRATGASRRITRPAALLGACIAKFEAGALCAVLDFDSGLHLE